MTDLKLPSFEPPGEILQREIFLISYAGSISQ